MERKKELRKQDIEEKGELERQREVELQEVGEYCMDLGQAVPNQDTRG